MALATLAGIAAQPKSSDAARVSACIELLNRGWGKPSQPITGKDEEELLGAPMSNLELAQWVGAILREAAMGMVDTLGEGAAREAVAHDAVMLVENGK